MKTLWSDSTLETLVASYFIWSGHMEPMELAGLQDGIEDEDDIIDNGQVAEFTTLEYLYNKIFFNRISLNHESFSKLFKCGYY